MENEKVLECRCQSYQFCKFIVVYIFSGKGWHSEKLNQQIGHAINIKLNEETDTYDERKLWKWCHQDGTAVKLKSFIDE